MKQDTILIVDDLEMNREMLAEIFEDHYQICKAGDGKEAIDLLQEKAPSIAIVLLDLIMPVMDGYQVMEYMKDRKLMSKIPVILITGEQSAEVERRAYEIGVSDIVRKPFDTYIIKRRVTNVIELYLHKNHMEHMVDCQTQRLKEKNMLLKEQTRKLQEINDVIIDTISNMVEFRNLESGQHIKRIKKFSRRLAEQMALNFPEYKLGRHELDIIEKASAMHDIGKIGISDSILLKPGKLTPEEFDIMKTHTLRGCELIEKIADVQGEEYYRYSYDICRYHHERYDGKGYPDGLKGEEIPIAAQIVSVADVYDALVSSRVYKAAYERETAFRMILEGECGTFSPKLILCLEEVKEDFERLAMENSEEIWA